MKRVLIIIARQGFQDKELEGTRRQLLAAGHSITLGATLAGECVGKFGGKEEATVAVSGVQIADYDLLVFIGGPGAHNLIHEKEMHELIRSWMLTKNPIGAICIAPMILAAAGILKGRHATVWDAGEGKEREFLQKHGAFPSTESVVQDDVIVTANGPEAADSFGKTLVRLLH